MTYGTHDQDTGHLTHWTYDTRSKGYGTQGTQDTWGTGHMGHRTHRAHDTWDTGHMGQERA